MNRQQRRAAKGGVKRESAAAGTGRDAVHGAALAAAQAGRGAEAIALIDAELARSGEDAELRNLQAALLYQLKSYPQAEACLRAALAQRPDYSEALLNLAAVLRALQRPAEALAPAQRACALAPQAASNWTTLGNVLADLNNQPAATEAYRHAVALAPNELNAVMALATARNRAAAWDEALALYERAAALAPNHPGAQNGRAMCLSSMGRYAEGEAAALRCVELAPDWIVGVTNLSALYSKLQRWEEAAQWGRRAAELQPSETIALGQWAHRLAHLADWENLARAEELVRWNIAEGRCRFTPFALQTLALSPLEHRKVAEASAVDFAGRVAQPCPLLPAEPLAGRRLRLGYISSDLRESAVSGLMGELFELHDKSAFAIHAYALDRPAPSAKRERLRAAADRFVELAEVSDEQAAALIHADRLDFLIDLNGYTDGVRANILAARPAPLQATWLGYLGGMGGRFIDYLISDRVVTPPGSEPLYAEHLLRLPGCYQINDRTRPLPPPARRADLGLPDDAVVMACFNQTFKITPSVFAVWMQVMVARPAVLLWLIDAPEKVRERLRARALAAGVDPARLRFAPRLPQVEHYARLQQVDLFADTTPVGAGATASDVLWCAVPLVTPIGPFFGARVAASLLATTGLASLAARDLAHYEQLLLGLIDHPETRAQVRAHLTGQRAVSPLFDSPKFARRLEWGVRRAVEQRLAGQMPRGIDVPDEVL